MVSQTAAPHALEHAVRRATADDAPLVAELYAGLSRRSLDSRFGAAVTPESLRAAAEIDEHTVCFVATADGHVVGEARYVLWEGVHELAVTIADRNQGQGLGGQLIDRLRSEADARGVTSLRAVVQADNAAMLRILERRGISIVRAADGTEVVVDVATNEYMPGWGAPSGRTRVLVESRGFWENPEVDALRQAGFDIRQCPGPRRSGQAVCPLVAHGRCRLAEEADMVAHLLPANEEACAEIFRAHGRSRPDRVVARSPVEWRTAAAELLDSAQPPKRPG